MTGDTAGGPGDNTQYRGNTNTLRTINDMTTKQISAPTSQIRVEDDGSGGLAERAHATLFYDGGCPLCSREVAHYRGLDQSDRVPWVDIHATPRAVDSLGVNYVDLGTHPHHGFGDALPSQT